MQRFHAQRGKCCTRQCERKFTVYYRGRQDALKINIKLRLIARMEQDCERCLQIWTTKKRFGECSKDHDK